MKKILLVDDSSFLRAILKEQLSKNKGGSSLEAEGYQFLEADEGATALARFKEEKPDLVLLDIVMGTGGREGIAVLKAIKHASKETKVIMLTAVGQEKIIAECKMLGADDYVTKPFNENELLQVVARHLVAKP